MVRPAFVATEGSPFVETSRRLENYQYNDFDKTIGGRLLKRKKRKSSGDAASLHTSAPASNAVGVDVSVPQTTARQLARLGVAQSKRFVKAVIDGNEELRGIIANDYLRTLAIVVVLAFMFLLGCVFLSVSGIGCPITFVTGFACPGCGMTRAYLALFSGDIAMAFAWHPLFWCVPIVAYLTVLFGETRNRKIRIFCMAVDVIVIIAYFALWWVRFVTPDDINLLFDTGMHADVVYVGASRLMTIFRTLLL